MTSQGATNQHCAQPGSTSHLQNHFPQGSTLEKNKHVWMKDRRSAPKQLPLSLSLLILENTCTQSSPHRFSKDPNCSCSSSFLPSHSLLVSHPFPTPSQIPLSVSGLPCHSNPHFLYPGNTGNCSSVNEFKDLRAASANYSFQEPT